MSSGETSFYSLPNLGKRRKVRFLICPRWASAKMLKSNASVWREGFTASTDAQWVHVSDQQERVTQRHVRLPVRQILPFIQGGEEGIILGFEVAGERYAHGESLGLDQLFVLNHRDARRDFDTRLPRKKALCMRCEGCCNQANKQK